MSKKEKLLRKLALSGKTFNGSDLIVLLTQLGYEKHERAGSRVVFIDAGSGHTIYLHKPHPENHIKGGAFNDVKQQLTNKGFLQ